MPGYDRTGCHRGKGTKNSIDVGRRFWKTENRKQKIGKQKIGKQKTGKQENRKQKTENRKTEKLRK